MNEIIKTQSIIIWQQPEMDVPEAALVIEPSEHGYVSIQQEDRYVLLNYETLSELAKVLKSIKKP